MKNIKPKRKGRPPLDGGHSLLVRAGELPENRRYIRAFLTEAREGLVRDLGPTEQDLTTAQLILIGRVICKLGILRCIEEYIRETGVMRGNNLAPSLQDSYVQYSSNLRMDLAALGIKTRVGEGVLDLGAYIRAKDAEKSQTKARKASRKARQGQAEAEGPGDHISVNSGIMPLWGRGEEISGEDRADIDCSSEGGQGQAPEDGGIGQPSGPHSEDEGKDDDREASPD